jgi:hypothetical protein
MDQLSTSSHLATLERERAIARARHSRAAQRTGQAHELRIGRLLIAIDRRTRPAAGSLDLRMTW